MSFVTKAKKDSQEKETLQIYKRCVINYCFFTVEGNKINEWEKIRTNIIRWFKDMSCAAHSQR